MNKINRYTKESVDDANKYLLDSGEVLYHEFDESGEYFSEEVEVLNKDKIETIYKASLLLEEEK